MEYMQSNQIISFMILGCIILLLMVIFAKPVKFVGKFLIRSAISCGIIFATNFFTSNLGLSLGINFFNAAVGGIFGITGIIALYIIKFIIK